MPDTNDPQRVPTQQSSTWCQCPRQADLWRCRDQSDYGCDPEGRCCALRFVIEVQGSDYWDRAAAQLISETECEGCGDDDE